VLRLFSVFPAGAPGVALLILRISLAVAIVDSGLDVIKPAAHLVVVCLVLAVPGLLLFLGFLTPVVSIAVCVFELTALFVTGHAAVCFIALSSLNAAAVALLGPGAYSLDSRLFGRREIVFPPRAEDKRR
jgi:uncharacterized membrane protein YphA (DoxX/SURF4 family)